MKITIIGMGNLGSDLALKLDKLGVSLDSKCYTSPDKLDSFVGIGDKNINIHKITYLRKDNNRVEALKNVDFVIVTIPGKELEKELDFLVSLKKKLIILSTGYDRAKVENFFKSKNATALLAENIALPIIKIFDAFRKIEDAPKGHDIYLSIRESHQAGKKDVSGTAIKVLDIFSNKGFTTTFNKNFDSYSSYDDSENGSIVSIRNEGSQLDFGVRKIFLNSHAYHTYNIFPRVNREAARGYMKKIYDILDPLTKYSMERIIDIDLKSHDDGLRLEFKHNINGRNIYANGVYKALEFLSDKTGVYDVYDLLDS